MMKLVIFLRIKSQTRVQNKIAKRKFNGGLENIIACTLSIPKKNSQIRKPAFHRLMELHDLLSPLFCVQKG